MKKVFIVLSLVSLFLLVVGCRRTTTYTVTFDSNGGTAVTAITANADSTITAPTAPTRAGFTFDGWYKESSLTTQWNFQSDRVNENITLYAKWTEVGPSDEDRVNAVYDWLSLGNLNDLTNASPRIIMPTQRDGATITWQIDKTEYIASNGMISQPTAEEGTQTVTLTATITFGSANRTKTFTAVVVALPGDDEMPPLINETFESYQDGNIIGQDGVWMPVSGKTGSSLFTVVSTIPGSTIPQGSKALKIEALTELQIEAPLFHNYDVVVIEVDLMQTGNGSSVNIQTSASSPVIGFGLTTSGFFYRVDNGPQPTLYEVQKDTWYRMRLEADLVNKTIEVFYYDNVTGQLIALTDGPVSYNGSTDLSALIIRSGSSTTTELRDPAYLTNLVVNRIESLPRPDQAVKLGTVTGIDTAVSLEVGSTFTPSIPTVRNYFGSNDLLTKDTDYTVNVSHAVDMETVGTYEVIYTITSVSNPSDVKIIVQTVTVYSTGDPNEILSASSTMVGYISQSSKITLNVQRPEGTLYYFMSDNESETTETIKTGASKLITTEAVMLENLAITGSYIHFVVDLNGESNIFSHALTFETVTEITTIEAFYAMASVETSGSYALMNDLDFTGFTWNTTNASFKGRLYGNGFTISNITMASTTQYGGIFSRANGAHIQDLVLDTIHIQTTVRSGALIGRIENTSTTLENIVLKNTFVQGDDNNGVGGLIGMVATEVYASNIAIVDSTVRSVSERSVGGFVGRVDGGTLNAHDIYLENVTVISSRASGEDIGAGGLIGYVRDSLASVVIANNIVLIDVKIDALVGGALIGYLRGPGSAIITNAYLEVEFIETENGSGVVGRVNDINDMFVQVSIFGKFVGENVRLRAQGLENDVTLDTIDNTWWETNLPSVYNSDLWTVEYGLAELNNLIITRLPNHVVTIDFNIELDNEVLVIREGSLFEYIAPQIPGFEFVGLYLDSEFTTVLPENFIIEDSVTIYAKYDVATTATVSFDTGHEDVTIPSQLVNIGEVATVPESQQAMFEGILKEIVGWSLNGEAFDFATEITGNVTLVAVWETVQVTVTIPGFDSITVDYGQTISAPTEAPTHPLQSLFSEVSFVEWQLAGVAFDFDTPITEDITLTASWNIPTLTITTVEQFYYVATSGTSYDFVLGNDLDFTGFEWIGPSGTGETFGGTLDGQGYILSNIAITGTGYGGIFTRTNGANISNLIIKDLTVNVSGRAGALIGQVTGATTLNNITIINASVIGNDANGVGLLIGMASQAVTGNQIIILDSTVFSNLKNVGVLAGRSDNVFNFTDVYIARTSVESAANATDDGIGGIVGYTNNANASIHLVRVVLDDVTLVGRSSGALVGYFRFGSLTTEDAFLDVTFVYSGTNSRSGGIIGRRNNDANTTDPVMTNVYGYFVDLVVGSIGVSLESEYLLEDLNNVDQTWWTTNLENLTLNVNWSYDAVANVYTLVNIEVVEVTIDLDEIDEPVTFLVYKNTPFSFEVIEIPGFNFIGFFLDSSFETALPLDYILVENVTIYAQYESVPASTVTFETNVEGVVIDTQSINYGELATQPSVPQTMIDDVLKEVLTWTLDGVTFDFDTPITENITLVAVWTTAVLEVNFAGVIVPVTYGETVTPPSDPVYIFSEITFNEWRFEGVAFDFNTPITENISLTISWNEPTTDILITTVEQFLAMVEIGSDYTFVLQNDLDFTGVSWARNNTGTVFTGTFNGQSHTLSNITMTGTGYGGIFARTSGATIINVVIDNAVIDVDGRGGILIGQITGATTLEYIHILNSSVSGKDANGVGILIGMASQSIEASSIIIENSTAYSTQKNVSTLIGRADNIVLIDDLFIVNSSAETPQNATDAGIGGIVGYTNNANAAISLMRVVLEDVELIGRSSGALVGYYRFGTLAVQDAFLNVTYTYLDGGGTPQSGIIGRRNNDANTTNPVLTDVYGYFENISVGSGVTLHEDYLLTDLSERTELWWETNLPNISESSVWFIDEDGSIALVFVI